MLSRREQRPYRVDRGVDDGAEVDGLQFELQLPACDARNVEQVVEQPRHVRHLAMNHLARPRQLVLRQIWQRQHLGSRAYRRQGIPELVRQRGEELVLAVIGLTQRFLALAQPCFGLAPIGHVELGAHGAHCTAVRSLADEERLRTADDPTQLAVAVPDAVLEAESAVSGRIVCGSNRLVQPLAVVGMDLRVERRDVRLEIRRCIVDLPELMGPIQSVVGVVVIEHADVDEACRELELRLASDQTLLGLLARCRIERYADDTRGAPGRVVQEAAAGLDPYHLARIGLDHPVLAAEQRVLPLGSLELGKHALAVFRMQARPPHLAVGAACGIDGIAKKPEVARRPYRLARLDVRIERRETRLIDREPQSSVGAMIWRRDARHGGFLLQRPPPAAAQRSPKYETRAISATSPSPLEPALRAF